MAKDPKYKDVIRGGYVVLLPIPADMRSDSVVEAVAKSSGRNASMYSFEV